jgi:hypothetical protein
MVRDGAKALLAAADEKSVTQQQREKPEEGRHQDQSDDRGTFAGTARFGLGRNTQGRHRRDDTAQNVGNHPTGLSGNTGPGDYGPLFHDADSQDFTMPTDSTLMGGLVELRPHQRIWPDHAQTRLRVHG